ncbi:kelch-like protein 10 [Ctenocephalides felis]|uniref:kelch-like protein 10 n=1 Tax=Ctenocephalides felis TaxID=7515 RepID=UPI000E6E521B|nr:kelch-like protein 10 [Ctenocephalides felis]
MLIGHSAGPSGGQRRLSRQGTVSLCRENPWKYMEIDGKLWKCKMEVQGPGEGSGGGRSISASEGRCMSQQAMMSLYEMRQNNLLCDAVIRVDDGTCFPVHRAILCACSSYFRALFTTSLNNERTDVTLSGLRAQVVSQIIEYSYLRRVDVGSEAVHELLVAADYLGVLGVLKLCCDLLQAGLKPDNCIGVMRFARARFCHDLELAARAYLMRHFVTVATQSDEILGLPLKDLEAIVSDDELNVKNEEVVWECVLRWINFDPETRKQHVVTLMKAIRLGLLDTRYFMEHVKEHPFVVNNDESKPVIIETLTFLYDLDVMTTRDGEILTPGIALPRVPHEILFAIGGWSGGSPTNYIETYDTRADRWVRVEEVDPAGPRAYHGTAVVNTNIYVIGGFDGMDYFNSCRCFDAVTKQWKEVAPMNARRCYVSVAVLNDMVYAMGGFDGHHRQNTAERYDHRTNQWSLIASMIMQRSDASACTLDSKIYITGGFNGQECMNTAEVYDPDTNQWTLLPNMRTRRSGVSCISYHGQVYVIGGFNGMSRMSSGERYNPASNTWSNIREMYHPRSNFAIEVIDDMIFVIGGFNGVTTIYHVECYEEKTNEWYEATDMSIFRSALSASVIMGLPNVRDYIHQNRERLMEERRQRMIAGMILKYFASGDRLRAEQGNNGPNPPPLPAPPTRGNPPILQIDLNALQAAADHDDPMDQDNIENGHLLDDDNM